MWLKLATTRIQTWANVKGGNTIITDLLGNNFISSTTDNIIYQLDGGKKKFFSFNFQQNNSLLKQN